LIHEINLCSGYLGGVRINSESTTEDVFKEYQPLEPKKKSVEHYIVMFLHLVLAIVIFAIQFNYGLDAWFQGFGLLTPILLIINGFVYSFTQNDTWYREQMVPFISRVITTTEIETDRYRQFHRRIARYALLLGWISILMSQFAWTFGLTQVMPFFIGDDLLTRFIGEFVAIAVIFGPFFLYFIFLISFMAIIEKPYQSRYKDIAHLLEIENKWAKEAHRRAKNPEAVLEEEPTSESHW
jgi:hypothetical protein